MGRLIVDADVLIDASRSKSEALDFIEEHEATILVSVVTMTELYAGIRNTREESSIANLFGLFEKIDITEEIALQAGRFRHRYGKSHGAGIIDCLIAATAEIHDLKLVTLNKKHYPMVKNVWIPYRKV